jgi:hypothetical protein
LDWGIEANEAPGLTDRTANDDAFDDADLEDDGRTGWGNDCECDDLFEAELDEFLGGFSACTHTPPVLRNRFASPEVQRVARVLRAVFGPVVLDVEWCDPARRQADLQAQVLAQLEAATFDPMSKGAETFDPGEWPVMEIT